MELVRFLDFCPTALRSSKTILKMHFECSMISTSPPIKELKHMMLYVFESCIEIGKIKTSSMTIMSPKIGGSKVSKLQNINSASHLNTYGNPNVAAKRLRHIELIEMKNINNLILIEDPKLGHLLGISIEENKSSDDKSPGRSKPLISLKVFKFASQENTRQYIDRLHTLVAEHCDALPDSCYYGFGPASCASLDECLRHWSSQAAAPTVTNSSLTGNDAASSSTFRSGVAAQKSTSNFNRRLSRISNVFSFMKPKMTRTSISYHSFDEMP